MDQIIREAFLAGDIVSQVPWMCEDKECPRTWHMTTYWLYENGTYSSDEFSDGDHQDCEASDIPEDGEVTKRWAEYYLHVIRTGVDELNQLNVAATKEERWQFEFRRWIGEKKLGAYFMGARRNGRGAWKKDDLPAELVNYLHLKDGKYASGVTCEEIVGAPNNRAKWHRGGMAVKGWATIWVPRSQKAIEAEIRELARGRFRC